MIACADTMFDVSYSEDALDDERRLHPEVRRKVRARCEALGELAFVVPLDRTPTGMPAFSAMVDGVRIVYEPLPETRTLYVLRLVPAGP